MPIVSVRQSDQLPATSRTRLASVDWPAALIVTEGVVTTAPLLSLYSIADTPEPTAPSVPVMFVV